MRLPHTLSIKKRLSSGRPSKLLPWRSTVLFCTAAASTCTIGQVITQISSSKYPSRHKRFPAAVIAPTSEVSMFLQRAFLPFPDDFTILPLAYESDAAVLSALPFSQREGEWLQESPKCHLRSHSSQVPRWLQLSHPRKASSS